MCLLVFYMLLNGIEKDERVSLGGSLWRKDYMGMCEGEWSMRESFGKDEGIDFCKRILGKRGGLEYKDGNYMSYFPRM